VTDQAPAFGGGDEAVPGLAARLPRALDLSPLAAARTLTADPGQGSFAVTTDDYDDRDVDRAAEARLAQGIVGLARAGTERLPVEQRAHELTALVSRPWEVILRPLRQARYHFHGAGVDAIIRGDGSVQWRDKSGLHFAASQTSERDGVAPSQTFGVGFHDAPAGKLFGYDPHQSERRMFLERTRSLRDLLHERSRRVALARAAAHLDVALTRIEIAIEAGDDARAHQQLFALWDECSEDEVGSPARQRIEAFVRAHCQQGSEHGYVDAELLAFNARRASRRRFAPYASEVDGGLMGDAATAGLAADAAAE
jgi:hypothetical protein